MSRTFSRDAVVSGQFYEGTAEKLRKAVRRCVGGYVPEQHGVVVGGVAPHAGWMFSGPTAARVFQSLKMLAAPETYVLLGAVHRYGVRRAAVYPTGFWNTPLGPAPINEGLAAALVTSSGGRIIASAEAHESEHSIEVQVPFIQALSPRAQIVPLAVPPDEDAVEVGRVVGEALRARGERTVIVASTDLTHYGMGYGTQRRGTAQEAMEWMRQNDHRIIRFVEELRAEEIVAEADAHENACGAGALAAATAAARVLGAVRARTLHYTTSAEVMGETQPDRAVGYVGMVFEK